MSVDIFNFYIVTLMTWYDYTKLQLSNLLKKIIQKYNLHNITTSNDSVYVEVQKYIYELLQAGLLAKTLLKNQLNKHGYHQSTIILGLWTHTTQKF